MNSPITYYDSGKIKIVYSPQMDGYWLNISKNMHFFDSRTYEDISKSTGPNLMDKLNSIDSIISFDLRANKILPSELVGAFESAKEKELREFEEFKQTNNL